MKASKILLDFVNSYKNKKIIICGHERPDADSTSSQFALQFLLNALGICEVYCVKQSPYQRNLAPLLSAFKTIDIEDIDKQSTLVCVDCSSMSRISKEIQSKFSEVALQIDHHASNNYYAKKNLVEEYEVATAEIISNLFIDLNIVPNIDVARLLYAGLISDSRSFSLPTTTFNTFEIAKWLLNYGVEPNEIYNVVFNSEPIEKIKLQNIMFDNIEFYYNNRICIGTIRQADIKNTQSHNVDKTGFVEKMLSIENVEIAVLLTEKSEGIKVNMRSLLMNAKLNTIAETYGGGGHFEAAAFTSKNKNIAELKLVLADTLSKMLSH